MKKIILVFTLIVVLLTASSCYKGVTYLKLPTDNDSEMFTYLGSYTED